MRRPRTIHARAIALPRPAPAASEWVVAVAAVALLLAGLLLR